MSTRTRRPSDPELPTLYEHVERWVAAAIISQDEAEAIERFETEPARPASTPLVVEALAYLGGALAAAIVVLNRTWSGRALLRELDRDADRARGRRRRCFRRRARVGASGPPSRERLSEVRYFRAGERRSPLVVQSYEER